MSQTHDEVRALRVMVEELRAESPPELPWDAIEQRLLSRTATRLILLGESPPLACPPAEPIPLRVRPIDPRRGEPRSSLAHVFGLAAAAAVLALGITSATSSGELPSAAAPPRHLIDASAVALEPGTSTGSTVHDLSALRAGDVVEAGDAPVTFARAGLVAWTLAPGSALRVRSGATVGHTVVLERGSLRAEVTPRDPSEGLVEAFAVEVGGTRVAVHGTAFSVTIEGDRLLVDVEHGAVAVGPVGYAAPPPATCWWARRARPSRSTAAAPRGCWSARPSRSRLRPPTPSRSPPPTSRRPSSRRSASRPATARSLPGRAPSGSARCPSPRSRGCGARAAHPVAAAEPAPAAPEAPVLTAGVVRARLERCFKQTNLGGSSGLAISVSSTLRIDVHADGSVAAALRSARQGRAGDVRRHRHRRPLRRRRRPHRHPRHLPALIQ